MVVAACDSARAPTTPSPAPTPLPESPQHRVSGIVSDAASGAPIANAIVMLRYTGGTLTTRANGDGFYAFSFDASQPHREPFWSNPPTILGLLITSDGTNPGAASRHWTAVQSLPWGTRDIVHNVRLRPVRTLAAGQSMGLSVEPDSSLVWDSEWDPWTFVSFDAVREEFLVSVQTDGMLTIDARSEAGGAATLTCRYGGCPDWRVQGTVSIPVQAHWSPLYFAVEIPPGSAPQRYAITASLR